MICCVCMCVCMLVCMRVWLYVCAFACVSVSICMCLCFIIHVWLPPFLAHGSTSPWINSCICVNHSVGAMVLCVLPCPCKCILFLCPWHRQVPFLGLVETPNYENGTGIGFSSHPKNMAQNNSPTPRNNAQVEPWSPTEACQCSLWASPPRF